MPRKPKKPKDLTDAEALKKLFPKKVREELYRVAHEKDDPEEPDKSKEDSD